MYNRHVPAGYRTGNLLIAKPTYYPLYCPPGFNRCFSFVPGFGKLFDAKGSPSSGSVLNLFSPHFLFIGMVIMIYLFVLDDSLTS